MNNKLGIEFLKTNQNNSDIQRYIEKFGDYSWELNEQEYSWLRTHDRGKMGGIFKIQAFFQI